MSYTLPLLSDEIPAQPIRRSRRQSVLQHPGAMFILASFLPAKDRVNLYHLNKHHEALFSERLRKDLNLKKYILDQKINTLERCLYLPTWAPSGCQHWSCCLLVIAGLCFIALGGVLSTGFTAGPTSFPQPCLGLPSGEYCRGSTISGPAMTPMGWRCLDFLFNSSNEAADPLCWDLCKSLKDCRAAGFLSPEMGMVDIFLIIPLLGLIAYAMFRCCRSACIVRGGDPENRSVYRLSKGLLNPWADLDDVRSCLAVHRRAREALNAEENAPAAAP